MKNILIITAFNLLTLSLNAQFHYTIKSSPDSAVVTINGEKECLTPCRVKYYWKDKKNKMIVFAVQSEGYDTWTDTISEKPKEFDKRQTIDLKPSVPVLQFDSINPLIGFDRLLAVFKDGEQIGSFTNLEGKVEVLKWEGSVKLGEKSFEKKFYEQLTNLGFETPISESSKLFAKDDARLLPRFLVGAQITEYNVIIEEFNEKKGYGNLVVKTRLKIDWKVMDQSTDQIALSYSSVGEYRQRENYSKTGKDNALRAFEMALIDFIKNSEFYNLIISTKPINVDNATAKTVTNEVKIAPQTNPKFEKLSEMIQYASASCVTIVTDAGHGSGVIASKDGYIITANHVVENVNKIRVRMSSGIELEGRLVASDSKKDVALLKIDGSGFQTLSFNTEKVGLGEEVIAIGTPADVELGQSVSKGMISGNRAIDNQNFIQIDISVSPGNSGGPLLNENGEIIGIIQRKLVGSGVEGIGFAIPVQIALESLGVIIAD